MSVYPWQSETLDKLSSHRARLPHALLLHGNSGIGKFDFAMQLAKSLLCLAPSSNGEPCEQCASCGWYEQNNHPDFRLLAPEQEAEVDADSSPASKKTTKKSQISIVKVRELAGFLSLSSHQSGGLRVVVIHPAEALNIASANGLLKMLEEPPAGVIFILVTHQISRLLPTIISRCQKIDMPIPAKQVALDWLQEQGQSDAERLLDYAGGAPLNVIRNANPSQALLNTDLFLQGKKLDPFHAASVAVSQGMEVAIDALQKWVYDLLSCHLTNEIRYHNKHASALQALAKSVDLGLLLDFQRKLGEAKKSAHHPLNNELQLETIFLTYTQLFMKKVD
jgi:DNA polymerase III subunit delta'